MGDDNAVPTTMNARVILRIREAAAARKLTYMDIAGLLNWTKSKVAKKLTRQTAMDLDELEALCFAVGIQPTEAVRDRGLEFCAEMTPTELRMLELLRALPKAASDGLLRFLLLHSPADMEPRGATPKRSGYGKPRKAG